MRLNDAFPDWTTKGVFHFLQEFDVPWKNKNISSELDMVYHGNHSGDKLASPLLIKLVQDDVLTDDNAEKIAKSIYSLYVENWKRKWEIIITDYDPIENYRMIETETKTGHEENDGTGSVNGTSGTSSKTSLYGFNSVASVDSDESTGSGSDNTSSQNHSDTDTTESRSLTRSGNIGVTTSQQMAESQISLWAWNFFSDVFSDIDRVLTLSIY